MDHEETEENGFSRPFHGDSEEEDDDDDYFGDHGEFSLLI